MKQGSTAGESLFRITGYLPGAMTKCRRTWRNIGSATLARFWASA